MTKLDEWLKNEREMLEKFKHGPVKIINEPDMFSVQYEDERLINHVRTSHEQALKLIESFSEGLKELKKLFDEEILIRNTENDSNFQRFLDESTRVVNTIKKMELDPEKL